MTEILVHGKGLHGLSAPSEILDVGNSGTTTRLISGILAGQSFTSELNGDASIQSRPMKTDHDSPSVYGGRYCQYKRKWLCTFAYYRKVSPGCTLPVTGCFCPGKVLRTSGRYVCRWNHQGNRARTFQKSHGDHVELFGSQSYFTKVLPPPLSRNLCLKAREIQVPGDISSAAYFIAAGLLTPGSQILLRNVGINPTRDGILKVCRAMGADITLLNVNDGGRAGGRPADPLQSAPRYNSGGLLLSPRSSMRFL